VVGWQEGRFDFQDPPADSIEHWYENGWEYGAGIKFRFTERVAARFEFRNGLWKFPSPPAPVPPGEDAVDNQHFTGGLEFALGGSSHDVDTDNDGVGDHKDRCPDTPAGCRVDDHGCPIDTDRDGVCDGLDQCENTPAGIQVDERGCPRDSDRDGVPDGTDQCADTPAGCQVDSRGCPVDSDRDGVCDGLDQCPDTPSGTTVDAKGCPNVKDSDNDGVPDDKDQCPDTPANLRVDKDGCPIEVIETEKTLMETGMIRLEDVHFVTAKADIMDDDKPRLDTVGQVLLRWPQLRIEIGGHADWRGTRPYNQRLSEQRVESVLNYLLQRFPALKREQYTTRGYGEDKPIADNRTDQGMAKNRRVEFVVLNKDVLQEEVRKRRLLEKNEGTKP
jgi:outer membrane protein OmpA-like peptidoglycan-associated protein